MLGGATRDPNAKNLHTWHNILKVDQGKQKLFMQRVLLLHEIASKKGGRASSVRLTVSEWNVECDRCCLVSHILEEMEKEVDSNGVRVFPDSLLIQLAERAIEGTLSEHRMWFSLGFGAVLC